jgi:hypothetical protein
VRISEVVLLAMAVLIFRRPATAAGFVGGPARAELAEAILQLMEGLGCGTG